MGKIFPFFNSLLTDCNDEAEQCRSCSKLISNKRHTQSKCTICGLCCHADCLELHLCKSCKSNANSSSFNFICTKHVDPFNLEEDDEHDYFFDDDIDDSYNAVQIVKKLYNHHNPNTLPLSKLCNTTFYFNNIDAF